jgi:hypothetical protein
MSLLLLNSLPAERERGCKFVETFGSTACIEKNGGSVAGTVASGYPTVATVKTVIAKLSTADTSSNTVKINSGQTITITAGDTFGSYTNATAFDADDIQVDDYSKFEYVKIFSEQLSAAELTAYENDTMWTYDDDRVLYMDGSFGDCGSTRYDPTNSKHVDADGNSSADMTISAATKLRGKRGYDFTPSNAYLKSGDFGITASKTRTVATLLRKDASNAGYAWDFRGTSGTTGRGLAIVGADGTLTVSPGGTEYVNGESAASLVSGTQSLIMTGNYYGDFAMLGCVWSGLGGVEYDSDIYEFRVYDSELNHMQVYDVHFKMLRALNREGI